jgi:hypothetical protein
VIYLLGAGRSGSTAMDVVLGHHPDVIGVGELANLQRSGWERGTYCACGERGYACPFWREVREDWETRTGTTAADYIRLQREIEDLGPRQLLNLCRDEFSRTPLLQEYLDQTRLVYESVSRVSGKRVIVDSSKMPVRAALLRKITSLDLRIVHLVRDCRAFVWARKKAIAQDLKAGVSREAQPRSVWYSTAFWILINMACRSVVQSHPEKSARVRYEDFAVRPEATLAAISRVTGVDFGKLAQSVAAGAAIPIGHPIAGNRLRMSGSVRLKADDEWTTKLSSHERSACWTLAGCLLEQYRYTRTGEDAFTER